MTATVLPQFPRQPHVPSRWERATKFINPLILRILRSPLHGLLSERLLIVSVRGRRTGTLYHVPVEYRQELGEITIYSQQGRAWWRNLEGGADVNLHLRGFDVHAVGEAIEDRGTVIRAVQYGFRLSPLQAVQFAQDKVLIKLRLSAIPQDEL
jgi:hypothetical protein